MLIQKFVHSQRALWLACFRQPGVRTVTIASTQRKLLESDFSGVNRKLLRDRHLKVALRGPRQVLTAVQIETMRQIGACTASKDYFGAIAAFKALEVPHVVVLNATLNACVKGLLFREASEVWDLMKDLPPNSTSYSTMIELCARVKLADEAEIFFNDMREAGFEPNIVAYNSLMRAYSIAGRLDELKRTFEVVCSTLLPREDVCNQETSFTVCMSGFARVGDYAECRELFMKMLEMGIKPAHTHFNALMTSCARGGHADIAQAIFTSMGQWSLKPRVEDYTILIGCFRHDLQRVKELFMEVEQAGLKPTGQMLQAVLEVYVLAGDLEGGRAILAEVPDLDRSSRKMQRILQQLEGPAL